MSLTRLENELGILFKARYKEDIRKIKMNKVQNVKIALTMILLVHQLFCLAQTSRPTAAQFQNNDKVTFIGNSITRGGGYHANLFLFYATRFPSRKMLFYNCGISGDTGWGTVNRFSWDILPQQPTVATIKLGTNDVGLALYDTKAPDQKNLDNRKSRLLKHDTAMRKLADLLYQNGSRVIIIIPSILEATSASHDTAPVKPEADSALAAFAIHDRKFAKEIGAGLVDFRTIMDSVTKQQQKIKPEFSLINPDRIHPNSIGHMIMTYAFLKAQGMPKYVSKLIIDTKKKKPVEAINCHVANIRYVAHVLTFSLLEKALPFPVSKESEAALDLIPFQQDFNQERLAFWHLKKGNYQLAIDGIPIGKYSDQQLNEGVNLADNTLTPQYKQALKIMKLNNERHQADSDRSLAFLKENVLLPAHVNIDDTVAIRTYLKKVIDEKLTLQTPDFTRLQINRYLQGKVLTDKVSSDLQLKYTDEMYKSNKPIMHQFTLSEAK